MPDPRAELVRVSGSALRKISIRTTDPRLCEIGTPSPDVKFPAHALAFSIGVAAIWSGCSNEEVAAVAWIIQDCDYDELTEMCDLMWPRERN